MYKKIFLGSLTLCLSLGLAATALAQGPESQAAQAAAKAKIAATFSPACMQAAVAKRENALMSAFDTRSLSTKTVLQKRGDAQTAAWALTDAKARRLALKKVWTDYSASVRKVAKEWQTNRKNAWKQFTTDRKACGKTAASEDGNVGEGADNQL